MKRSLGKIVSAVFLTGICVGSRCFSLEAEAEVKARADALKVAGAFSKDGFKVRDGHWCSRIEVNESKVIQVNLFAGNQYWFAAAAVGRARRIAVAVFDEKGDVATTEPYENNTQAAAGFAPQISGPYYVRVEELEGGPSTFCLIYSYK